MLAVPRRCHIAALPRTRFCQKCRDFGVFLVPDDRMVANANMPQWRFDLDCYARQATAKQNAGAAIGKQDKSRVPTPYVWPTCCPGAAPDRGWGRSPRTPKRNMLHRPKPLNSKRMTKQQMIDKVAAKTELGKAEVAVAVDSVLDLIADALRSNERVDLRGFGSFLVKERKERQGAIQGTDVPHAGQLT